MQVAIIGDGQVGRALARSVDRSGHTAVFGVREPARQDARQMPISEAVAAADVVILAIPYSAAGDVLSDPAFAGRIVVDATNPLTMESGRLELALGFGRSVAETIAAAAPHVRLVKAFNQTGFENLADPARLPVPPVMLIAGDDPEANAIVAALAGAMGFDPVELGGLREARLLEPLAMIWIKLARIDGRGPDFAFALTRKEPS
ncbi:MAG: hypothetical protein GC147_08805 [Porphyrobacter sp.]|nr:hypothetical protein [Porphyrobacter sp.]